MATNEADQIIPPGWGDDRWDELRAALRALPRRVRVLLAAGWARSVLPIFETSRPDDDRPRTIAAAERWAIDPSEANRNAAANAAADADPTSPPTCGPGVTT